MNDSPPSARRSPRARLARSLLIAAGAVLALYAIAAVAVPLLIERVVVPRLGESIGRQVTVERVRFNPFKLTLSTGAIRVSDIDPASAFVTVAGVDADLSISSLMHLAPVIDRLGISEPVVHLYRQPDGRFNFSDIVDRLQAAPEDPASEGKTMQFALRDFALAGGAISFDDRLLQQKHQVSDLRIAVPFISNLEEARNTAVRPVVTALVNGSALSITGVSVPFGGSRETSLDVNLRDAEIATYLPLSPVTFPLVVKKGRLGTELKVAFAQEGNDRKVAISGTTQVDDLQIDARDGARLLSAGRLRLGLEQVAPLAGDFLFGDLEVEGLDVDVERASDGGFPIARALVPEQAAARPSAAPSSSPLSAAPPSSGQAATAQAGTGSPATASPGAKPEGLRWSIRRTRLAGGRVAYRDRSVSPPVQLIHSDVDIELAQIGNRQEQAAAGKLSLKQNDASTLAWTGEVDLARSRAAGRLTASVAALTPYRPYLAGLVKAQLDTGALAAEGDLELGWAQGLKLELADAQASVNGARLTLPDDSKPAIVLGRVAAQGLTLSLAGRRVDVARVELSGAEIEVLRDAAGKLNLQRFASPAGGAEPARAKESPRVDGRDVADGGRAAPEWAVKVTRVDLAGNRVAWRDLAAPQPVTVAVTNLGGTIGQVGTDLAASSSVDLNARVGEAGTVTARGSMVAAPLSLQLAVQVQRLALSAFDPYVAEKLALGIDEGAMGTAGQLDFGKGRLQYRGRLEVDGLRSRERTTSAQAIRWQKLLLEDIDVDVDPTVLGPGDRITVGGITLNEFFARVVLSEQGRFNLQDIVVTEASTRALARADEQAKARADSKNDPGARNGGTTRAGPQAAGADEGAPPAGENPPPQVNRSEPAPSPSAPQAAATGPTIRVGRIKLERGSSNFTDRFVQPNYSVNLTELDGSLSAMASDDPKPADLALTGRVDGSAPIDISGKMNPFGPTLYTDVRAVAKGIDLPTLTPYALKYAGYAIEKGKLSLDVHYTIENEQLRADNNLFLDQLTLGDKVEGPGATSLPIQFALSLLKNSKGEINVTLPVSGSLDDPQFSIGGLIGRAIVNLLTRVITAPFSALASAFSGGGGNAEELSFVEFRPGSATLTDESIKRLQTLSKGLLERPVLKLEIAGRVDPKSEKDAIERQQLDARLKALKRKRAAGADATAPGDREEVRDPPESGAPPGAQGARDQRDRQGQARQAQARQAQANQEEAAVAAGVTLSKEEYPVLLKVLYDEAGLVGRGQSPTATSGAGRTSKALPTVPANAASESAAIPPVAEMEKQLLETMVVDAETTRRLATRRSQVVRRWLAAQGKIPEDRMFMLAPRLSPDAVGPNQSKPQCSASCVEFSLR